MTKLHVKEHKKLILKNVVMKQHQGISIEETEDKFEKFINQTNMLNIQTFGPLVTINRGTTIHDDGTLTTDYELLVQAHDYKQYQKHFAIKDRIEFPHCVYLKFKGPAEEIHYAHSKLDLYFYENNLQSNGEVISVLINETADQIELDLFKPVVQL